MRRKFTKTPAPTAGGTKDADFLQDDINVLNRFLEEYRNGHGATEIYFSDSGKPEGIPTELADVIIRVLDYCGYAGIDIDAAISQKHEYNKSRPYRHGGKKC